MQDPDADAAQGRSPPRLYEVVGSRPPDGIPQVSSFQSLERPASPTSLEQQRSSKKSKGNSEIVSDHDSMTIDDEQIVGLVVVEVAMSQHTEAKRDGERSTYASKVAANGLAGTGGNGPTGFREDVVTILEDDIILYRNRPIPSIQFSDRVHDQIDHNLKNALIVRLLGQAIGYNVLLSRIHALWKPDGSLQLIDLENNYFIVRFSAESDYTRVLTDGLWTIFGSYWIVQTWSRTFTTSEKYSTIIKLYSDILPSVGESALDVDDGNDQQCHEDVVIMENLAAHKELKRVAGSKASGSRQVAKNVAYKTSNLDKKKSRSTKKGAKPVEVIPIVEGRPINVVEHAPKIVSGSHSAIRIIEDGHSNAGTMRVASTSMGRAGKVILEGANKGFKVKKLMDSKVARSKVVEWVKSAHARIDQHNESGIMVGDGSSEMSLAMDGLPRAPTAVGVEHDPYDELMSDSGDRLMDRLGGD
ncbi:hypothetical protein V6N11_076293 [Hibiscus sabdariffa]|uniref:DUF4283 domain-containing protein n=1 Tax=Hibiscus sabdariffa TaxID=183260 RepID=A0ABR2Q5U9_9ROSI